MNFDLSCSLVAINMFIECLFVWCSWIQESQALMSERGYESASKVWSGKDTIGIFHTLGITNSTFSLLKVQQRSLPNCYITVCRRIVLVDFNRQHEDTFFKHLFICNYKGRKLKM